MPIAPEFRHFYSGAGWRLTRQRVLTRAEHCCESCGKPRHALLWVMPGGRWFDPATSGWRAPSAAIAVDRRAPPERGGPAAGPAIPPVPGSGWAAGLRRIRCVITVAHLNHVPGDDRLDNLAALCQACHLRLDQQQHAIAARLTRRRNKDSRRPLLAAC